MKMKAEDVLDVKFRNNGQDVEIRDEILGSAKLICRIYFTVEIRREWQSYIEQSEKAKGPEEIIRKFNDYTDRVDALRRSYDNNEWSLKDLGKLRRLRNKIEVAIKDYLTEPPDQTEEFLTWANNIVERGKRQDNGGQS